MSTKYVLALDQGTTSSRAILFDNEQNIIAVQQREFAQIYQQPGWVEHNPMEIWSTQYGVMNEVVALSLIHILPDRPAVRKAPQSAGWHPCQGSSIPAGRCPCACLRERRGTVPVSYTHL